MIEARRQVAAAAGATGIRITAERASAGAVKAAQDPPSVISGISAGLRAGAGAASSSLATGAAGAVGSLGGIAESGASAVRWWSAAGIAAAGAFALAMIAFIIFQVRKGLT